MYPCGALISFTLDVDIACLIPEQDRIPLVVENEVALTRSHNHHGVPLTVLVDDDCHSHRSPGHTKGDEFAALHKLIVFAVTAPAD